MNEELPDVITDRHGRQWRREFGFMYAINTYRLKALRHIDDILRRGR